MVNLALRLFVSIFPTDCVHLIAIIISLWINVRTVCVGFVGGTVHSVLSMIVRRKNLSESVAHLEFAIESSAKESLVRVEASVFHGMSCCWRVAVVKILIG